MNKFTTKSVIINMYLDDKFAATHTTKINVHHSNNAYILVRCLVLAHN